MSLTLPQFGRDRQDHDDWPENEKAREGMILSGLLGMPSGHCSRQTLAGAYIFRMPRGHCSQVTPFGGVYAPII